MKQFIIYFLLVIVSMFTGAHIVHSNQKALISHIKLENDSLETTVRLMIEERNDFIKMYHDREDQLVEAWQTIDSSMKIVLIDTKMMDAVEKGDFGKANRLRTERYSVLGNMNLFHLK